SVLQAALGSEARVIAEGLNGRTTAFYDHLADCDRNGARILPTILQTHAPLDLFVLLLVTNDMKPVVAGSAFAACQGISRTSRLMP
ncbi:arylesterase, partial [Rhizobium ruizarguesonis]